MNSANPQQEGENELSFDIKITNGAAKLLHKIKEALKKDSAKEVVSLGLQIIDYALSEDSDLVVKKKNGEEVRIILNKATSDTEKGNA